MNMVPLLSPELILMGSRVRVPLVPVARAVYLAFLFSSDLLF